MKMGWFSQFMLQIKNLKTQNDDKSHYVYMKDFDRFVSHKTKNKTKNGFVKVVYNVLVVTMC